MLFKKSFFFTVDAPAILLTIHAELFGPFNTFPPSPAIVVIEKWRSNLPCQCFANRTNRFMVLVFTVEQGRRETVKLAALG